MVANMLKGMIVGSRPHAVRETTTMKRHDYGPWMCVPMNVVNRPTTTILFFRVVLRSWGICRFSEADYGGGWCAVEVVQSDGCAWVGLHGRVPFRLRGIHRQAQQEVPAPPQLEQQFLGLFLGGILKLDKLDMAWQTKSSPSRKPRLKGVLRGESMVSDTIAELADCGLRKPTRDLPDRDQAIFGEIPILFACAENAAASPASGGCDSGGGLAQLEMRLSPSPANVTQGTMLQLGGLGGGGGWPRSAMPSPGNYGPQNYGRERDAAFKQDESRV